jgi:hypothetical protein
MVIWGAGRGDGIYVDMAMAVDLGTARDVAAGMVKAEDGGKEVHNLTRGCRDCQKYGGKNNNKDYARNMANN